MDRKQLGRPRELCLAVCQAEMFPLHTEDLGQGRQSCFQGPSADSANTLAAEGQSLGWGSVEKALVLSCHSLGLSRKERTLQLLF